MLRSKLHQIIICGILEDMPLARVLRGDKTVDLVFILSDIQIPQHQTSGNDRTSAGIDIDLVRAVEPAAGDFFKTFNCLCLVRPLAAETVYLIRPETRVDARHINIQGFRGTHPAVFGLEQTIDDIVPVFNAVGPDEPRLFVISPAANDVIKMILLHVDTGRQHQHLIRNNALIIIARQIAHLINRGFFDLLFPDFGKPRINKVHQELNVVF